MKFILGKKLEMSQVFSEDGEVIPVTIIEAGPCQVTQIRTKAKDGYSAVQVGLGFKKKLNKPTGGHLKGLPNFRYLSEFRTSPPFALPPSPRLRRAGRASGDRQISSQPEAGQPLGDNTNSNISNVSLRCGDKIMVDVFKVGDKVKVTGVSKGKGFQGVVKRHGFHGAPATHGHKDQLRMPGSIGSTDSARVFKGTRMGGRMGGEQVTMANLEIVKIDKEKNLMFIKGAIPGSRNSLVEISGTGEMMLGRDKDDKETRNQKLPLGRELEAEWETRDADRPEKENSK